MNSIAIKIFCIVRSTVTSIPSEIIRSNRNVTMPPSIHNPTFWLFLFVCANITNCWDINHVLKTPHQFADINLSRITRNSENETLIWMEYEFNTGAGNREGTVQDIILFGPRITLNINTDDSFLSFQSS